MVIDILTIDQRVKSTTTWFAPQISYLCTPEFVSYDAGRAHVICFPTSQGDARRSHPSRESRTLQSVEYLYRIPCNPATSASDLTIECSDQVVIPTTNVAILHHSALRTLLSSSASNGARSDTFSRNIGYNTRGGTIELSGRFSDPGRESSH